MSNCNAVGTRVRVGVIVTSLCVVLGLASCGGGESPSATNTTTPTNKTTTVATPTYSLTVTNSSGGTVISSPAGISCGSTCSATYTSGAIVTLYTAPAPGYSFTGWSGACTGIGTCTATMSAGVNVTATFTLVPPQQTTTYPLTVTKSGTGTGSVSSSSGIACGATCSASIAAGTSVTLAATPNTNSTFAGWSGGVCAGTGNCTTTMSQARSVTATFTLIPVYTLSVTNGGGGTVSSSPSGISCGITCSASYNKGTSVTLTAIPTSGYSFSGWSGACSGTGACTTTMSQANSVAATFTPISVGGNPITLSLVPARTSGVAPLSVFFDASGTTDPSVTSRPFHDLEYRWNFGDATAGTWAYGAKPGSSKNDATGPVASHVFETSGTYNVTLSAFDGVNTTTTYTTITVQDPNTVFAGTNTICVAQLTTPVAGANGCPAGALTVMQPDFATAINTYALAGKRLLFKRGDTFTGSTSGVIHSNGPGIIGAYGVITDPRPILMGAGTTYIIEPARGTTGDWRIMDLALNGRSTINGANVAINATGPIHQVTLLRLDITGVHSGVAASHWALIPGDVSYDQWSIQDSTVSGIPNCNWNAHYDCNWRIYVVGTRWSIQGNYLDAQGNPATGYSGGSHVVRMEMLQKSLISNNIITGAGIFQHNIKLHAWAWNGGGGGNATAATYTEKVMIADNKIQGGANPWQVSLGPQDTGSDERVRDIILERNWFTSNSATQVPMHIASSETTIRNNICDLTGAAWHTCVLLDYGGVAPDPSYVRIYNNTFYSGSTGDFNGIEINALVTNTTVRNNLGSAPLAANQVMFVGSGTGLVQSNNILDNTPSALFVSATPATPSNFSLRTLPNPARDTGFSTVPVFSDFFLTMRPQNGLIDIGAVEGP